MPHDSSEIDEEFINPLAGGSSQAINAGTAFHQTISGGTTTFTTTVNEASSAADKYFKYFVPPEPKYSYVCVHCKRQLIEGKDSKYLYAEGQLTNEKGEFAAICNSCLGHFTQCHGCNHYFYIKDLKDQFNHCLRCIERAPHNYIRNYTYKVNKEFEKIGNLPKDQIYYGIELELESENLGLDVLIVHSLIQKFAILKKDSSIKRGFEIVSAPATIDAHYELWNEFFEKLPKTCRPLSSCGMHVHATRDRMSDLQIGKILEFLHARDNREFIKLIAGRDKPVFLGNGKGYDELEPKKIKDMKVKVDRHTALNLNNHHTIEFRIFWSTRDKRIFLKNLEFCRAIIKWTEWATTSIQNVTDYKQFVEFVKKDKKEYEYLCLFFETPSMRQLLED